MLENHKKLERQTPPYEYKEFFGKKRNYALAIPVWNEGERIQVELRRIQSSGSLNVVDVFLLDNDSTDGSLADHFLKEVGVRAILNIREGGQGGAFRAGFSKILDEGYEGIITVDGNNKDSVEKIPQFVEALERGCDFVQGSRFAIGGKHVNTPVSRHLAMKLILIPMVSFLAGYPYTEVASGFRGYSRRFLTDDRLDLFREVFRSYEFLWYTSVKAPRLGFRVEEISQERLYPQGKVPTKINWVGNVKILLQLMKLALGFYESSRYRKGNE